MGGVTELKHRDGIKGSLTMKHKNLLSSKIGHGIIDHSKLIGGRIESYPYPQTMLAFDQLSAFCKTMGWEYMVCVGEEGKHYNPDACLRIVIQKIGD